MVFRRARVRLTTQYTGLMAVIVIGLSVVMYFLARSMGQSELRRVGAGPQGTWQDLFSHDQFILASQFLTLDFVVLICIAFGAYWLAGRTLAPIRETMERQRQFASAASHELRTPLTALHGSLEVALLRVRSAREYRAVIEAALDDTERMSTLVAQLIQMARTESGRSDVAPDAFDLASVVRAAVNDMRPMTENEQLSLEVDLDEPIAFRGDRLKLRQVFVNLLENAVAYTPEGGSIRVRAERSGHLVHIHVDDTGCGISEDDIPHIFEPFYRGATSNSNGEHAGLGLALVDWIVRSHGGHVDVESRRGQGTSFDVVLPLP